MGHYGIYRRELITECQELHVQCCLILLRGIGIDDNESESAAHVCFNNVYSSTPWPGPVCAEGYPPPGTGVTGKLTCPAAPTDCTAKK